MAGRPSSRKVRFPRTSGGPIERRPEPGRRSSSWKGAFAIASLNPRARRPSFRPRGRGSWNREYFTRSRPPALSDSAWTSIAESKMAPAAPDSVGAFWRRQDEATQCLDEANAAKTTLWRGVHAEGVARPTGFDGAASRKRRFGSSFESACASRGNARQSFALLRRGPGPCGDFDTNWLVRSRFVQDADPWFASWLGLSLSPFVASPTRWSGKSRDPRSSR